MRTRRSFLLAVTGLTFLAVPALSQTPRRRFGCSDHDPRDPSWAHGSDNDRGPRADPVLRFLNQDATDTGANSDAPSHRRNRPQVFCPPRKRQRPARL
jgi:hypothetical protein